ncbi:MAG: hypothetical protein ACKOC8_09425 [Pirellulales bacterium]
MKSSTDTLISAMRILSRDIHCEDGAATAAIAEAADRLAELRLTDAERRDLTIAADAYASNDDDARCERIAATLRGLLERLA